MKSAKIYTTDRMFEKLEAIFEKEKEFTPVLEEDKIIVNILRQVMANSEECDEDTAELDEIRRVDPDFYGIHES